MTYLSTVSSNWVEFTKNLSFKFVPLACRTFLKYTCTQTQNIIKGSYQKSLPEVDVVDVDIEYTNDVLMSSLSKLSFKRNLPTQRQMNSSVHKVIRSDSHDKVNAGRLPGETQ